ncbi:MAG: ribosomal protein L13e [Candidatus Thorarchaeota archaeon]|nr:ribosomal protein L13e [Candidatus Thorarchaeota archaeon]
MSFITIAEPTVKSPKDLKSRIGRGFSRGEVSEAGLTVVECRRMGLMIDIRRRSSYPENVEALKRFLEDIQKMAESLATTEAETPHVDSTDPVTVLSSLSAVSADDAKLLVKAGIRSIDQLAYCDVAKVTKKTGIDEAKLKSMISAALKKI